MSRQASVRTVLWKAQAGRCWLCEAPMRPKGSKRDSATRDHVFPRAVYGPTGTVGLLVLACQDCNVRRGSTPPTPEQLVKVAAIWSRVDPAWIVAAARQLEGEVASADCARKRLEICRLFLEDAR